MWLDLSHALRDDFRFTAVFTYVGVNYNNKSGESNKFWAIERPATGGDLQLRYGPIAPDGTTDGGRTIKVGINPAEALVTARRKEKEGYTFRRFHTWARSNPLISDWAKQRQAPFNRIATLCAATGEARDVAGNLVCRMPVAQVRDILSGLS